MPYVAYVSEHIILSLTTDYQIDKKYVADLAGATLIIHKHS